jgi:hypothetical protein
MFYGYVIDCNSSLFISAAGIWLIGRATQKDAQFLNGLPIVPVWLHVAGGVLLQVLLIVYIYVIYLRIRT